MVPSDQSDSGSVDTKACLLYCKLMANTQKKKRFCYQHKSSESLIHASHLPLLIRERLLLPATCARLAVTGWQRAERGHTQTHRPTNLSPTVKQCQQWTEQPLPHRKHRDNFHLRSAFCLFLLYFTTQAVLAHLFCFLNMALSPHRSCAISASISASL